MTITLLAIESSCDETSAAILQDGSVLSNIVADQSVHKEYGGVVPELASRAHQKNIVPVVEQALKKAGVSRSELDAIAFTRGPGLIGPLLVGTSFAKSLALGLDIPLIEVNHMHAHVLSHFIDDPVPSFPYLCLTVSGGHTQIVKANDYLDLELLGETRDDAAGEAFDKAAKLLGLPYPGGPLIDQYAQEGNPNAFDLPEPNIPKLDFSFSGLKTAILYYIRDQTEENDNFVQENRNDICAVIQHRIVTILRNKLVKAADELPCSEIAIAGGVAANSELRETVEQEAKERGWNVYIPDFQYCTDNAAMIAVVGYHKYKAQQFTSQEVAPTARYPLTQNPD